MYDKWDSGVVCNWPTELMGDLDGSDKHYTAVPKGEGWAALSHTLSGGKSRVADVDTKTQALLFVYTLNDPSRVDFSGLYLVAGRVLGDDDDTQHVVEAVSQGEAESVFVDQLREDSAVGDKAEVCVINMLTLREAVGSRIKSVQRKPES